jgi:hypothetical protein
VVNRSQGRDAVKGGYGADERKKRSGSDIQAGPTWAHCHGLAQLDRPVCAHPAARPQGTGGSSSKPAATDAEGRI